MSPKMILNFYQENGFLEIILLNDLKSVKNRQIKKPPSASGRFGDGGLRHLDDNIADNVGGFVAAIRRIRQVAIDFAHL